jgi:hypothetical protein
MGLSGTEGTGRRDRSGQAGRHLPADQPHVIQVRKVENLEVGGLGAGPGPLPQPGRHFLRGTARPIGPQLVHVAADRLGPAFDLPPVGAAAHHDSGRVPQAGRVTSRGRARGPDPLELGAHHIGRRERDVELVGGRGRCTGFGRAGLASTW